MKSEQNKIPFNTPFFNDAIIKKTYSKMLESPLGSVTLEGDLTVAFKKATGLSDKSDVLFTQSATQSLEIMALSLNLKKGDEIILPSYTYAATANAFARTGATLVFSDVSCDTVNLTSQNVSSLITKHTKAIVPIHYGGISADMNGLSKLGIPIFEDAAHGIGSLYNDHVLGSFGTMGCFSFHHTKNITAGGSGGALVINDSTFDDKTDEIINQGTDRTSFLRGDIPSYKWNRLGGEYKMTPYSMAFLLSSLESIPEVTRRRRAIWEAYKQAFRDLELSKDIKVPNLIEGATQNGHIFYLIMPSLALRDGLKNHLLERGIKATTHYEPLHLSKAGQKFGVTRGAMPNTEYIGNGLLRLPIYYTLTKEAQNHVIDSVLNYCDGI